MDHPRVARKETPIVREIVKKNTFCHFVNLRFEVDTIYDKLISCIYGARASFWVHALAKIFKSPKRLLKSSSMAYRQIQQT